MTRDIDSAAEAELESSEFRWVMLLELGFDSGTVYLHSGVGDLSWNSQTWMGVGAIGSLSGVVERASGSDNRTRASLSPIPSEFLADLVGEVTTDDPIGRPFTMYFALLDTDGAVVGDAITLNAGTMDEVNLSDGLEAIMSIDLVSDAARLKQTITYNFTNEHQQQLFSGDLGLEFVNDVSNDIRWGSADPQKIGEGSSAFLVDKREGFLLR